jgi:hypothetical protein
VVLGGPACGLNPDPACCLGVIALFLRHTIDCDSHTLRNGCVTVGPSVPSYMEQLRRELKGWREEFVRENGGRQPSKEELRTVGVPLARTGRCDVMRRLSVGVSLWLSLSVYLSLSVAVCRCISLYLAVCRCISASGPLSLSLSVCRRAARTYGAMRRLSVGLSLWLSLSLAVSRCLSLSASLPLAVCRCISASAFLSLCVCVVVVVVVVVVVCVCVVCVGSHAGSLLAQARGCVSW